MAKKTQPKSFEGQAQIRLLTTLETIDSYPDTDDEGNPKVISQKVTGHPGDIVEVSGRKAAQLVDLGYATDDLDSPLEQLMGNPEANSKDEEQ